MVAIESQVEGASIGQPVIERNRDGLEEKTERICRRVLVG